MKKNQILILALGILLGSAFIYANSYTDVLKVEVGQTQEQTDNKCDIMPIEDLYTNYNISGSTATFTSGKFVTSTENGNDINVHFNNEGTSSCTVTLYKEGLWGNYSKVDSFNVMESKARYKKMPSDNSATYYVIISNYTGSPIKGDLRVKQLD